MDKLQLLGFFAVGFFVSRLIIAVGLPEALISRLVGRGPASLTRLIFVLIALSAGLSFFIPNAVTVLTLLPVVEVLRKAFTGARSGASLSATSEDPSLSTLLALSIIYGSNIGGLGSLTATPANGIFVAWLEAKAVIGREAVQFATWLLWGVPLVAILVLVAWLVLVITLRPGRWASREIVFSGSSEPLGRGRQGWAFAFAGIYLVSSTLLSLWMIHARGPAIVMVLGVSFGISAMLIAALFVIPVSCDGADHPASRRPLLRWAECTSGLPWRGFALVAVAIALGGVLYALKLHLVVARLAAGVFPPGMGLLAFLLVLALMASLTTEVLSNTAVQLGLFLIVGPVASKLGVAALRPLLVVTLSSTCAFMSPIATGVNGLAFGGVRGVSLRRMLAVGLVMNSLAALVTSGWVRWIVWW